MAHHAGIPKLMLRRTKAALWHLLISSAIAILAGGLLFGVWYPHTFAEISGGRLLFLTLLSVDVVLGPVMTWTVSSSKKTRGHLWIDWSVIGSLQTLALAYGLHTAWIARPLHVVFEFDRFRVVHASEVIGDDASGQMREKDDAELGPTLLAVRSFRSAGEQLEMTAAAFGGAQLAFRSELWQPFEDATGRVVAAAQPMASLEARFGHLPAMRAAIDRATRDGHRLAWLPMLSRQSAWTVLLDAQSGRPLAYLAIDNFELLFR